ncbi:putative protein TPRXL [Nematostella vectensis]|uniref:putative protein TPRXL n=1 Tax=Nematostella vectensis TaxID=45351 RepID=UPI0020772C6E|nr:putative protein TPRXL [Nematostella vectensis]
MRKGATPPVLIKKPGSLYMKKMPETSSPAESSNSDSVTSTLSAGSPVTAPSSTTPPSPNTRPPSPSTTATLPSATNSTQSSTTTFSCDSRYRKPHQTHIWWRSGGGCVPGGVDRACA